MSLIGVILLAGTLDLGTIVEMQSGWHGTRWFIFFHPLGFIIYMIAAIAETNRVPFDLPEAETELVAGFHTEYSAMKFALFFLAEYINMFTVSMLATTLFLGGWNVPFAEDIFGRGTFLFGLVSALGFLGKDHLLSVSLHLAARDAAALSFRSIDELWLEDSVAVCAVEHLHHGDTDLPVSEFVMLGLLFILFAGMAIGCALAVVAQRNPLYSAISLIGVFISLACLYVMLAAPFIAAVQVIVYAGAIMVLVVFVIMLLNVEEEERRRPRLKFLVPVAIGLAAVLIAEVAFILVSVQGSRITPASERLDRRTDALDRIGVVYAISAAVRDHFDSVVDGDCRRDDAGASRRNVAAECARRSGSNCNSVVDGR